MTCLDMKKMERLLHYIKPHWKSRKHRKAREQENMLLFIRKYYINIRDFYREGINKCAFCIIKSRML